MLIKLFAVIRAMLSREIQELLQKYSAAIPSIPSIPSMPAIPVIPNAVLHTGHTTTMPAVTSDVINERNGLDITDRIERNGISGNIDRTARNGTTDRADINIKDDRISQKLSGNIHNTCNSQEDTKWPALQYYTPDRISFDSSCIIKTYKLMQTAKSGMSNYSNSAVFASIESASIENHGKKLLFGIEDLLLAAAIAETTVLIAGSSGSGKTYLSRLFLNSIFGNEYEIKDITPGLSEEDFLDIDMGEIKRGGRLHDAYSAIPMLKAPAKLINEPNRASTEVQNIFIPLLDNSFSPMGKKISCGVEYGGYGEAHRNIHGTVHGAGHEVAHDTVHGTVHGAVHDVAHGAVYDTVHGNVNGAVQSNHYQFVIMTMNIGAEYSGTAKVDPAVRDRAVITIPVDDYPPNMANKRQFISNNLNSIPFDRPNSFNGLNAINTLNIHGTNHHSSYCHLEDIIGLKIAAQKIRIEEDALGFLTYLTYVDNCIKSPNYVKSYDFTPARCDGCVHSKKNKELCGNVRTPSARTARKLMEFAKAFSIIRLTKEIYEFAESAQNNDKTLSKSNANIIEAKVSSHSVLQSDLMAIAPFVLYDKMHFTNDILKRHFGGSQSLAISYFVNAASVQYYDFLKNCKYGSDYLACRQLDAPAKSQLEQWAREKDAWAVSLQELNLR